MSAQRLLLALSAVVPAACGGLSERAVLDVPPLLRHAPPAEPIDVLHYAIALTLVPEARSIEAETRVELEARRDLTRVELDLLGLDVDSVEDGSGARLAFRHDGKVLAIELARPLEAGRRETLAVRYHGRPRSGLWFSGEDEGGVPTQVFTQGQARDSRGWFPCVDHPSDRATSEVTATVPEGWATVGAGVRVASRSEGGRRTDTWRMDETHPCYLVTLVAGELAQSEDEHAGVALHYTAPPRLADLVEPVRELTPRMLDELEAWIGLDYPYAKYGQAWVDGFPWGGMENVSATTLTPLALGDERARRDADSVDLYVHELAHQWFGDLVSCRDWEDAWLNEGFATYAEVIFTERTEGLGPARAKARRQQEVWLAHAAVELQPTVSALYREPDDLFDEDIYEGAAARIDHLRFLLGDEVFQQCVRAWIAGHAGRAADAEDFQRTCERVAGRPLGWFFEQWFLRPGFPVLDLAWSRDEERGVVELVVTQVQERAGGVPEVFRAPVEVEVRDAGGARRVRIELDERVERVEIPAPLAPLYVRFDVGSRMPKAVRWRRPLKEWLALAELCEDPTARVDAARALAVSGGAPGAEREEREACAEALARLLSDDPDPWVRAEAAAALGATRVSAARPALCEAADLDPSASVRAAALGALASTGPDRDLAAFADGVFADGYSWGTMGAAALLYARARPSAAFDWLVERLPLESPHDALRQRLLGVLALVDDPRTQEELRRWAADRGTDPSARGAAVRALGASHRQPIETARFLGALLTGEPSFHLKTACIEALATLDNPESRRILRRFYPDASDAGHRRAIEEALDPRP